MSEKGQVILALRATLLSVKGAITLEQCNRDYKELQGEWIPFQKLGYPTLEKVFLDVPGFEVIKRDGECYVNAIASAETQHIADMVSRQKSNKKSVKLNYSNRFPKKQRRNLAPYPSYASNYNNQYYKGDNNQYSKGGKKQFYKGGKNQYYKIDNNQYYKGDNNQYYKEYNNQYYKEYNNQYYKGHYNQSYKGYNNPYYKGSNNQYYKGGSNQYYKGGNNPYYKGGNNQHYRATQVGNTNYNNKYCNFNKSAWPRTYNDAPQYSSEVYELRYHYYDNYYSAPHPAYESFYEYPWPAAEPPPPLPPLSPLPPLPLLSPLPPLPLLSPLPTLPQLPPLLMWIPERGFGRARRRRWRT